MRIVRFIDKSHDLPEQWFTPLWGVLSDGKVYPLQRAPYDSRFAGR